jgi:hypothetical protein
VAQLVALAASYSSEKLRSIGSSEILVSLERVGVVIIVMNAKSFLTS